MPGWRATRALGRAVLLTGLLTIGAVVLGRVDLVLLATPFALGTAWALRRRPVTAPEVALAAGPPGDGAATGRGGTADGGTAAGTADSGTADGGTAAGTAVVVEGGPVVGTVSAANPDPAPLDLMVLRVAASGWLALAGAARPYAVAVPPDQVADVELTGTAQRWGRHRFGPAGATAFACDGLLFTQVPAAGSTVVRVYPGTEQFDAAETMPRAAGLIGSHRSRRPGEGGELAGVRRFAPGDRLRRIDWRVSLRTRQLHVTSTLSDRDAEVVLLLDLLAEAGRSGGVSGAASVLDTTVRAAAAIAEHYLQRGDRVSLVEYGPGARRLRPASGRRQYLTILEWLLDVRVGGEAHQLLSPQAVPAHALVIVLTPLVDQRTGPVLARLARAGRFVVAVDTLPRDLPPPRLREDADAAYRLWRLERSNTVDALREHGVPVVPWAGAGSLDLVLRDISRLAAAPRAGFT